MKVSVQTHKNDVLVLESEDDPNDTIMMLKILITSKDASLGSEMRLWYEGEELLDENATLGSIKYDAAKMVYLSTDGSVPMAVVQHSLTQAITLGGKGGGKGAGIPLAGRDGDVPMSGFEAVRIVVSGVTNEKSNGVYVPAPPHNKLAVWYKAPSDEEPAEEESKDRGERGIYYHKGQEKWFIGDELETGGFAYVVAWGNCPLPPASGWTGGAALEFLQDDVPEGDMRCATGLAELTKLSQVDPWADQETCYATMSKVLNNIASNPGEAKFCSIKVDNAAIQNKILKHDGARGFLEAAGFREAGGVLALPPDRHDQAAQARNLLIGFSTEASYRAIRKERHAKALEEKKKEAAMPKRRAPAAAEDASGGGGRHTFGKDRRGGGG